MKRIVLVCAAALLVPRLTSAQAPRAPGPDTAEASDIALPEVHDPMLVELPRPPNVLQTWQQALRMIRSGASNLRIANAQAELSSGQSRQALSRMLPQLTGTGNLTHHLLYGEGYRLVNFPPTLGKIPYPGTTWQAALGLRVPVIAAQSWYDYRTARDSLDAARLSAKEAQRIALGATADAIVTVVTSERLGEVSRVSLRFALSTLDLTRRRHQLGAANVVDVLRAEQEVSLARAQVISADENAQRSREALGASLGADQPWGVTPAIQLDSLARDARNSCRPEPNADSRPDVRAARANANVAERNVSSSDLSYVPTVDLVSNLTYFSNELSAANREHVTWTIGGLLTWPLYDGGLRYGQRRTAQGQYQVAREQLTQAKRQARFQIAQSLRGVRVAEANLTVSRRSRDIASENARLSRIAFLNGNGTSFDLVDTSRRLREADLDLAIKEFEVIRARVTALLAISTCDV
jgi:outer membrane protein TolC